MLTSACKALHVCAPRIDFRAMEALAKRVVGRPFPKGAAHPRYSQKGKIGKGAVPRLSDGRQLWQLFRDYTEDAATLLAKVMNDKREDMELRVRAAAMILQRGWGDAPKHLMLTPLTDTSRANELTEADILQLVRARPVTLEAPPSRGDEGGSLSGTGSSPPSEILDISPEPSSPPVVIDVVPTPVSTPLPVPDIPTFLTPPTSEPKA